MSWIKRVEEEHDALVTKIGKLDLFLNHSDRGNASHTQVELLREQQIVMQKYADILRTRLEDFT